jgi:hypothetical protein
MQGVSLSLLFLPLLVQAAVAQVAERPSAAANLVPIQIGQSVVTLNGPWRFHTGDDSRWAGPGFDDSGWETVDLTAAAGAHDSDVVLTGYVPGWTARGHAGYSGYAWYRIGVSANAPAGATLALTGPPLVDDAYQVFVNGRLVGSDGDFSKAEPKVYSIQPRLFPLGIGGPSNGFAGVIAFRVWMSAGSLRGAPNDAGGIHIAPALGERGAMATRYRLQWLQTFYGYVVDAVEPVLFVLLALFAGVLITFDPADRAYQWLVVALVLTALVRVNQVLFFWTQWESLRIFDVAKNVVEVPLVLAAWALAWSAWFRRSVRPSLLYFVVGLTAVYIFSQLLSRSWILTASPPAIGAGFEVLSKWLRLVYLGLMAGVVLKAVRDRHREVWITLPAFLLLTAGLFAQELSELHVPGIWFPFGVGVSRTQYVYAAFGIVMFVLLLRRLMGFARDVRQGVVEGH